MGTVPETDSTPEMDAVPKKKRKPRRKTKAQRSESKNSGPVDLTSLVLPRSHVSACALPSARFTYAARSLTSETGRPRKPSMSNLRPSPRRAFRAKANNPPRSLPFPLRPPVPQSLLQEGPEVGVTNPTHRPTTLTCSQRLHQLHRACLRMKPLSTPHPYKSSNLRRAMT